MSVTTREPCTLLRVHRECFNSIWRNNSHLQTSCSPTDNQSNGHDVSRLDEASSQEIKMVNNNVNNFNPILLQATSTFPPPDLSSSSGLYSDQQSSNTNTFYSPSQHHNHATPTTASSSRLTAEQMMSSSSSSASITQKSQGCSCPCSQRSASSLMSSSSLHRIKDLKVGLHHRESIERKNMTLLLTSMWAILANSRNASNASNLSNLSNSSNSRNLKTLAKISFYIFFQLFCIVWFLRDWSAIFRL